MSSSSSQRAPQGLENRRNAERFPDSVRLSALDCKLAEEDFVNLKAELDNKCRSAQTALQMSKNHARKCNMRNRLRTSLQVHRMSKPKTTDKK